MTSRRSLSAPLIARFAACAGLVGVVGCAILPNAGDDACGVKASLAGGDAGCGLIPLADGGVDGWNVAWDGGGEGGVAAPLGRKTLCGDGCTPDDALACLDDGGDAGDQACRVVLGAGQQTSTTCSKAGTGFDGASCTSGADCAAGFECVGTGTCRHYCCDDTACGALTGGTYDTYFCDIASEHAATGAIVPVCNVVKDCQLFGTDQCNAGQACTIVEVDNGKSLTATCTDVGDAKLGESCELGHCAAGYACIGAIGQRTCQELCDDQNPCPSNSLTPNCNRKSPALAQFNGVGVCGQ